MKDVARHSTDVCTMCRYCTKQVKEKTNKKTYVSMRSTGKIGAKNTELPCSDRPVK